MGKTKVDERGRVTIPGNIRDELGLAPGKEVRVEKTNEGVLIKPSINKEEFRKDLEGCITEKNQAEKLSPLKLKRIWELSHAGD